MFEKEIKSSAFWFTLFVVFGCLFVIGFVRILVSPKNKDVPIVSVPQIIETPTIDSISVYAGKHESTLIYKKYKDSVVIVDSAGIDSQSMVRIKDDIMRYYPMTMRETIYKWEVLVKSTYKIELKTVNGTKKEYSESDSFPNTAKGDLCKEELGKNYFGLLSKDVEYSEFEACVNTIVVDVKETNHPNEQKIKVFYDAVVPGIYLNEEKSYEVFSVLETNCEGCNDNGLFSSTIQIEDEEQLPFRGLKRRKALLSDFE